MRTDFGDELIVCSLEAWDGVWRRNQFLVRELLELAPSLRVLFVEPPTPGRSGLHHTRALRPWVRPVPEVDRLKALRPIKWLPRRTGPASDLLLAAQVRRVAAQVGFRSPMLWVNDSVYAPLADHARWPVLYDVTDDWLLAEAPRRELRRREDYERRLLRSANSVVVCSPALERSRGATRPVRLIPNAVDIDHFRHARPRPSDMPRGKTAVYVGTLHDERIDVALVAELAANQKLQVVLVGPDFLGPDSRRLLSRLANVHVLGARPYEVVPAYLQHADVVIVPHVISPFTESLDPIKAYECMVVERPTVATRVAGFRDIGPPVMTVAREDFVEAASHQIGEPAVPATGYLPTWHDRARAFAEALADGRMTMSPSSDAP